MEVMDAPALSILRTRRAVPDTLTHAARSTAQFALRNLRCADAFGHAAGFLSILRFR